MQPSSLGFLNLMPATISLCLSEMSNLEGLCYLQWDLNTVAQIPNVVLSKWLSNWLLTKF